VLRRFAWLIPLSLSLFLGACRSGKQEIPRDAAMVYDLALELPEGCPPAQANEKGIGAPCSEGGKECDRLGLRCTCDQFATFKLSGVPCVCTVAGLNPDPANTTNACDVVPANTCGSNAQCCPYMNLGYFCIPNVCLPDGECLEFISGPGT
jgi:hypothetical protein